MSTTASGRQEKNKSGVSKSYLRLSKRISQVIRSKYKDNIPKGRPSETRTLEKLKAPQPLQQKSYVKQPSIPDCSLDDFYCKICDVRVNNLAIWNSHISGKRHMKHLRMKAKDLKQEQEKGIKDKIDPKVQQSLDECRKPIVGLQYVVEKWKNIKGVDPMYHCYLCQSNMTVSTLVGHVISIKHQTNYLKNIDPLSFTSIEKMAITRSSKESLIYDMICKLATANGPGEMKIKEIKVKNELSVKRKQPNVSSQEEDKSNHKILCREEVESNNQLELKRYSFFSKNSDYCAKDDDHSYQRTKGRYKELFADSEHQKINPPMSLLCGNPLAVIDKRECRSSFEEVHLDHKNLGPSTKITQNFSNEHFISNWQCTQRTSLKDFPMHGIFPNYKKSLSPPPRQQPLTPEQLLKEVMQSDYSVKLKLLEELSEIPIKSVHHMKQIMGVTNKLMYHLAAFKLQLEHNDKSQVADPNDLEALRNIILCSENSQASTENKRDVPNSLEFLFQENKDSQPSYSNSNFKNTLKNFGFDVTDSAAFLQQSLPNANCFSPENSSISNYQSIPFLEGIINED